MFEYTFGAKQQAEQVSGSHERNGEWTAEQFMEQQNGSVATGHITQISFGKTVPISISVHKMNCSLSIVFNLNDLFLCYGFEKKKNLFSSSYKYICRSIYLLYLKSFNIYTNIEQQNKFQFQNNPRETQSRAKSISAAVIVMLTNQNGNCPKAFNKKLIF